MITVQLDPGIVASAALGTVLGILAALLIAKVLIPLLGIAAMLITEAVVDAWDAVLDRIEQRRHRTR